jgi:hypothetical protein
MLPAQCDPEEVDNNLWVGAAQGLLIFSPEDDSFTDVDSILGKQLRCIPQKFSHLSTT